MADHQDITLAEFLARTEEEGACLLWTGYSVDGKFPQWRRKGDLLVVRRVIYELVHGPVPERHQVGVRCKCDRCVHPDHLVARTRSRLQRGKPLPTVTKLRIARSKQAQSLVLDLAKVREIRSSEERGVVLDDRLGLTRGYSSRIRQGKAWVDSDNPFALLGGRDV